MYVKLDPSLLKVFTASTEHWVLSPAPLEKKKKKKITSKKHYVFTKNALGASSTTMKS
jgi:hypothetical protein